MRHLTWISIFLLVNWGCLDTIELDLPANPTGRTVIEGSVQRSEDDYVFRAAVRRTVEVVGELVFELEQADISILLNDQSVLSLANNEEVRANIEQFHTDYGGEPESALFKLSAKLGDGRTIESEPQKILEPPRNSTLEVGLETRLVTNSADNIVDASFVELFINSPLVNGRGERLSYLWEVTGVYRFPEIAWTENPFWFPNICYIPVRATLNQVNVVSSADINSNELKRYKINERSAGFQYHAGYYYTVILKAIDTNAAEYWKQVAASIKRDGTLFDTPPGKNSNKFAKC